MEFAFLDRAVAEEAGGQRLPALQLVAQRDADGERQAAADDRVAAIEPRRAVEDVHRAAAAAAAAFQLAEHLGHQPVHADAAGDRLAVLAVGRDDGVIGAERFHHADRHRLLAVIQMQKAEDLLRLVQLDAFRLEMPDADHLAQQMVQVRVVELDPGAHRSSLSSVDRSPSGKPQLARLQQPAHDLAAARFRQVRAEIDLLRRHRGAEAPAGMAEQLAAQRFRGLVARLQRDEGLDDLAGHRVGLADDAGLGDRRMLHQRAFDLERADQVAGRFDHVVGPPDEPEVAVAIALRQIAGQVPAGRRSTSGSARPRAGSRASSTASRPSAPARPRPSGRRPR